MKNYIVVGGTSGIGLEITKRLSTSGEMVCVLSRNNHPNDRLAQVEYIEWDATGESMPEGDFPDVVDGLVYCPGTVNLKPFHRISTAEFLQDYKINVEGAIKAIQFFLPKLKAADQPSILLFSTVAVQTGMLFHSSIAVSKGAIEGLTRSLAADLAPKVRVNCIAPSLVETTLTEKLTSTEEKVQASAKRHPLGRIGQPSDIANMAMLLLTNGGGWMTGQILHVDGGMSGVKL